MVKPKNIVISSLWLVTLIYFIYMFLVFGGIMAPVNVSLNILIGLMFLLLGTTFLIGRNLFALCMHNLLRKLLKNKRTLVKFHTFLGISFLLIGIYNLLKSNLSSAVILFFLGLFLIYLSEKLIKTKALDNYFKWFMKNKVFEKGYLTFGVLFILISIYFFYY
jgi:hypothetical protein